MEKWWGLTTTTREIIFKIITQATALHVTNLRQKTANGCHLVQEAFSRREIG